MKAIRAAMKNNDTKLNKMVPKRAPSSAKNEALDEKPKIVLHIKILVFMGKGLKLLQN